MTSIWAVVTMALGVLAVAYAAWPARRRRGQRLEESVESPGAAADVAAALQAWAEAAGEWRAAEGGDREVADEPDSEVER